MNNRYLTKIAETDNEYSPHYLRNSALTGAAAGGFHMITDVDMANRDVRDAELHHMHVMSDFNNNKTRWRGATAELGKWHAREGWFDTMSHEDLLDRKKDIDNDLATFERRHHDYRHEISTATSKVDDAISEVAAQKTKAKKIALIGAGVGLAATGANHLRHKWMDKHE